MRGWIFILLIILVGCSEPKVPGEYLSEEKMALVVLDLYLAEGKISFDNSEYNPDQIFPVYKDIILDRHGLSDSVYAENMSYYISHPRFLDKVYEIVLDSLNLRKQSVRDERPL